MSKQKKIIWAVGSLCLAVVVALVVVLAVLAVPNQETNPQNNLNPPAAKTVKVVVGAEYAYQDEEFISSGDSLTLQVGENEQSGQFSLDDIQLSDEKPFIVLKYSFANPSTENSIGINTAVTQGEGISNVTIRLAYSKDAITPSLYSNIVGKNLSGAVLGRGETGYVYLKISMTDPEQPATIKGTIKFSLMLSQGAATTDQWLLKRGVGELVTYGEYPQTFVGDELNTTLVEEYNKLSTEEGSALTPTGKTYHTDSNSTMIECPEYTYTDGQKYVVIKSAKFYSDGNFSTGESCSSYSGKPVFFKVEPIEFKIMDFDGDNTLTIFSEYILGSKPFNTNNNTWKDSALELFLNGQFIKESELEYNFAVEPRKPFALETTLQNNVPGHYTDGGRPESTDKIWLPSVNDLQAWYPDEGVKTGSTFPVLKRKVTDFAVASYAYTSEGYGHYFLRSAGSSSKYACTVNTSGFVSIYGSYLSDYSGFCPALKIYLDQSGII